MPLFGPPCADPALALETLSIAENSRQGFRVLDGALHPGITWSNSTTALGIAGTLYDGGIRSRCTGKEQDSETGLYYYGARYYEDALGRFMSPDPKQLSLKHLLFPQRWNKYTYVQNNPIGSIDPDGYEDYKIFLAAPKAGGNWDKAAAVAHANGHTLEVYKGKDASIANFNAALTDHNNRVIFVGHTSHEESATGAGQANAAVLGDGRSAGMVSTHQEVGPTDANGVATASEVPNMLGTIVNADTVGLFGCDSINLAPNFSGAGNFVGMNSGTDNLSTFGAMSAGAEAFVEADAAARPAGTGGAVSDATVNSSNQAFQQNRVFRRMTMVKSLAAISTATK